MITTLNHVFVDTIPDELEEGLIYVSIRSRVIIHSCCCGCKGKVVTPLSPARWKMTFDGKTITLYPSIGNWNFDCKSHYWIKNNEIKWAAKWTENEIADGKAYQREIRKKYYNDVNKNSDKPSNIDKNKENVKTKPIRSTLLKIHDFFKQIR